MSNCGFANWDLSPFFTDVESEQYKAFIKATESELEQVIAASAKLAANQPELSEIKDFILVYEKLLERIMHLICYMECARSEDVANETVNQASGYVDILSSRFRQAEINLLEVLKQLDEASFTSLLKASSLEKAAYYLTRLRHEARFSMAKELESLLAELEITGFRAWENLYESIAGKLEFTVTDSQGHSRQAPMSLKVSLLEDEDPEVRRTALVNSNASWESAGESVAMCLNCISGHRLTVLERRGVKHYLDNAAFESGLERSTLETMIDTVCANAELPRAYLRLKAKEYGRSQLGFQDLFAPVPLKGQSAAPAISWEQGCQIIYQAFDRFDPKLAEFAETAIKKRWVESEVRSGKRPGGFCTSSALLGESRIFMTYQGNLGDVFTLAHELGHAWHEWQVRDMRYFCHDYPMTLAETASTFAEQLLGDYLLSDEKLSENERLSMLYRRLDDAATYLLNIPMRFLFEKEFYRLRSQGEVPLSQLKELMLETQRHVYGDTIAPDQLDPWFWASKGHFYTTDVSFYNFPYIFGYLFSLGVYARALQEGKAFLPTFRELLRATGCASCEEAASQVLGADLKTAQFWESSLALVEKDWQALQLIKQGK